MDYDRVAHLYDAYVQTEVDIPFFLEEAKKTGGPVLELMGGTGRVSLPLLEAGIDLTCVDSSAGMLEVFRGKLRERGLSAELIEADVYNLSLGGRFDLIFISVFTPTVSFSRWQKRRISFRLTCTRITPVLRLTGTRAPS
jgi:ubiquinone/menaquinone biosynthesis C-methylase UbiE